MVGPGWHLQMSLLFDISRTEFLGWQLSCSAFSTMGESFGRDSSQKPVTSFSLLLSLLQGLHWVSSCLWLPVVGVRRILFLQGPPGVGR